MNVPGWLLQIVIGFLSDRELILRYKNEMSDKKRLPGGGPQGTILGLFLFLILINKAGFKDNITAVNSKRKPIMTTHLKYVNDLTLLKSLNLKKELELNPELIRPLNYHERTGHVLPSEKSKLQEQLHELNEYAEVNEMRINHDKSKVMIFNTARTRDFMPDIHIDDNSFEVVDEMRLLGLVITSNLKWSQNSENMCKRAYNRIRMLRRIKAQGAEVADLTDVYEKQIISILEFGAAVFTANLTVADANDIERVQKTAAHIILDDNYTTYKDALEVLCLETLKDRRQQICTNLSSEGVQSP